MDKTGVIIIRGNSITYTLSAIQESGYYRIIDELSFPLRLCYDLLENYEISNSKIEETLSILKSFKSLNTVHEAKKLIVVSTSFLSKANNKDILIDLIKDKLDIELKILSNGDEIYYDYLGVINSIYLNNAILIDISEVYTRIIWISDKAIKDSFTLPIGSTNLSYNYDLQDKILKEDLDKAIVDIKHKFNKFNKFKGIKFDNAIGVGETICSIAKLDTLRKKYPIETLHNYTTNDIDLHDIYNLLKCKNLIQRKRLDGLSQNISNIIVGGALLFQELISYFDIDNITISERGLKDGLIFHYIEQKYNPISDILDQSLNGIIENLNLNKAHSEHVYFITQKLFNSLKPIHHLGEDYNNIIKTASYLHDIGININYYNHHINSFYIILNSYINGLSHKELLISAAVAASHKNNMNHIFFLQYSSLINKFNIKAIEEIGILLSIAERLDTGLNSIVENLEVIIKDNSIIIKLYSEYDLKLEIQQVLKISRRFYEIYDRNLIISKN